MRHLIDTIASPAYWRYVWFSRSGIKEVLSIFGALYLLIEALDFFDVYTRDQYASYAFLLVLLFSAFAALVLHRPIRSIVVPLAGSDFSVEVRIGDLFEASGAVMICTNTDFECDVAGGKIATASIQGQFTARYYTGDQDKLIKEIKKGLKILGKAPYPMGTTVAVNTHGKTFYFVAMAELNEQGTASTTPQQVNLAMDGLWSFVRESGELQELVVPVIGTARGRLQVPRKKMIERIAESFVAASLNSKFSDRLVIMVHPDDAKRFQLNLYDIKDHLSHALPRSK